MAEKRLENISQHISTTETLVKYNSQQQIFTITLNRPKALNSLNLNMIHDLASHLPQMDQHQIVWLQGTGGKAFCAGGDVKAIFQKGSKTQDGLKFFRDQFILDYQMSQLKAVQISCWDGITMGGGVGLSAFSPLIIATEKTVFAMPEAKLGFFTDVGSTYILSRMRNNIGYYLGMTSLSLRGEEAFIAGLAHFYIPSSQLPSTYRQLTEAFQSKVNNPKEVATSILQKYHSPSGKSSLQYQKQIKNLFSLGSAKAILEQAQLHNDPFHTQVTKALKQLCPVSVELIHRLITKTKNMTIKQCFIRDYQVLEHMMVSPDFREGARCVLFEKGATPTWTCPNFNSLNEEQVSRFLKPISWSQPLPLK